MASHFKIRQVSSLPGAALRHCDFSFNITSSIVYPFDDNSKQLSLDSQTKTYSADSDTSEPEDPSVSEDPAHYAAIVEDDEGVHGYVILSAMWNGMASLDDIAVDQHIRGKGVGRQLIESGIAWARSKGFPAVRAETQSNNVAACEMYRNCGFRFGGYDAFLYAADENEAVRAETAMFWYYFLGVGKGVESRDEVVESC